MTKIVKTIDKVTNHENMRRYLHKKASKGGGTITADSITPELLENEDVLKKIQNWGLSDEEVAQLPLLSIACTLEFDEDLSCTASKDNIDEITYNRNQYNDIDAFISDMIAYPDDYIYYSIQDDNTGGRVLKLTYASNNAAVYNDVNSCIRIHLDKNPSNNNLSMYMFVGIDTF